MKRQLIIVGTLFFIGVTMMTGLLKRFELQRIANAQVSFEGCIDQTGGSGIQRTREGRFQRTE